MRKAQVCPKCEGECKLPPTPEHPRKRRMCPVCVGKGFVVVDQPEVEYSSTECMTTRVTETEANVSLKVKSKPPPTGDTLSELRLRELQEEADGE